MTQAATYPSREELITKLDQTKANLDQAEAKNIVLQARLDQLHRLLFGTKSERFVPEEIANQLKLELGEVGKAQDPPEEQKIEYTRKKPKKKSRHAGRQPLPEHLERKVIRLEPEQDTSGMKKIGEDVTEILELIPAKLFVLRYVRAKYAAKNGDSVLTAPLPGLPIEKGMAGPGLLAQVMIDKYMDHLPLYRQLQRFSREKVTIASSTIGDWVAQVCILISSLYQAHRREVLTQLYLMADETPNPVLDKSKKGKTHRGYQWAYFSPLTKTVLFDYRPGRGRDGPRDCLKNYQGFLQTDGYAVYEWFGKREGIVLLHCMAHARREFENALKNDPDRAQHALLQIQKLYAIERKAREQELSHEKRRELREEKARPIWEAFKDWMIENYPQVTPKSSIAKAIAYSLKRWPQLGVYILDGRLEIDNNLIENSIRPIALGRKNYLFSGSHAGARRAALMYSLLGTCKLQGINPFEWLRDVLVRLPEHPVNRVAELLPQNWKKEQAS